MMSFVKILIIDRETNRQSSTGSNIGLVPWGHAKPGSDADNVPLLIEKYLFIYLFYYIIRFSLDP